MSVDWRHRAACRDEDPELFFPVGNSGPALLQIAEAKTVCRRCPVLSGCLSWALESGQDAGVWGGMSEDERRALKRRNARTRARASEVPAPPATRMPLVLDGHVMAAPLADRSGQPGAGERRRRHAVDTAGRAFCCDAKLDLRLALPAAVAGSAELCGRPGCRKQFAPAVSHG